MSGSIYIKCNKCGNQQKLPFSSMGKIVCECGANDYLMSANSKSDNKPDWWVESETRESDK